ncbi:MAG: tRNA (cytidine(34)-2'-O)-methyltransferase [Actinomycetaceae bacterium]|nr:tRNA (cytidine(34)-2'-O)-methyltransferase [Actinomycetaceae bacterium]
MFHIIYLEPEIPGNTGAAIRLAACTGAHLHLIEPLGFNFDDKHLKRAGLDYHDLADVSIHGSFNDAMETLKDSRIFAFTGHTSTAYTDISYRDGDAFLFGRESVGLPLHVLQDQRITESVRIPMTPHRRSLNLSNATSIAIYEAWRQVNFEGSASFS